MDSKTFVQELKTANDIVLAEIGNLQVLGGALAPKPELGENVIKLLRIALANEISVAELASMWMPTVTDWEIKITLAKQAGDEARHFELVEQRLAELGVPLTEFKPPAINPLFEYLRSLESPVEKIATLQFTLESLAYKVNDHFLKFCDKEGDKKTAEIYRQYIQPDELHHHELGRKLLEKYAITEEAQAKARWAAGKTLEIAKNLRAVAAQKLGTACFPGC